MSHSRRRTVKRALVVLLLPQLAHTAEVLAEGDRALYASVRHRLARAALEAHDLARGETVDLVVLVLVLCEPRRRQLAGPVQQLGEQGLQQRVRTPIAERARVRSSFTASTRPPSA